MPIGLLGFMMRWRVVEAEKITEKADRMVGEAKKICSEASERPSNGRVRDRGAARASYPGRD